MGANIKDREDNPVKENQGEASVGSDPPWDYEGRTNEGSDLTPVKGYETHSKPMSNTEQLIDRHIIGSDPTHP
jgi:hypothetical protein